MLSFQLPINDSPAKKNPVHLSHKHIRITSLTNKVKSRSEGPRTTSVLTLKWRVRHNIWLISWILCISGQRDTLGQVWRLPLTATVNFQHNQFMCSSIITICVLQRRQRFGGATWFLSKSSGQEEDRSNSAIWNLKLAAWD